MGNDEQQINIVLPQDFKEGQSSFEDAFGVGDTKEEDCEESDVVFEEDETEHRVEGYITKPKRERKPRHRPPLPNVPPEKWNEADDGAFLDIEDDPNDSNYMKAKELAEQARAAVERRISDENFDPYKFIANEMSGEDKQTMDVSPFFRDIHDKTVELSTEDIESVGDLQAAVSNAPDLFSDDSYPDLEAGDVDFVERATGLSHGEMQEYDQVYKQAKQVEESEHWNKVMLRANKGFDDLSNETLSEIGDCLGIIGSSSYNCTRWLLYDLDFNISNLILAAVKHNPEAPIIFQHWYPQLVAYKRYKHAQDRNFDFTMEDVQNANIEELGRYYRGFGYSEIPQKAPGETGVISIEDMDEDDVREASFASWIKEVFNDDWDRKDFENADFQDTDNVFSDQFEIPRQPDLPESNVAWEEVQEWRESVGDDPSAKEYADSVAVNEEYTVVHDEEFEREFRGHLVIACSGIEEDLDIAEKITIRCEKEFGKKVFVETRVMTLAQEDDFCFEIWLESYDIELLHSKRRATMGTRQWKGPADIDDSHIDYLVDRVRFLISDDARYSYEYYY